MTNREFGEKFELRTKQFAVSILKMAQNIPQTYEGIVLRKQLVRSATSIGDNYREANRSKSEIDFKYKIRICEGEASETVYWLSILEDMNWKFKHNIESILIQANEILAVLTKISISMSQKRSQKKV